MSIVAVGPRADFAGVGSEIAAPDIAPVQPGPPDVQRPQFQNSEVNWSAAADHLRVVREQLGRLLGRTVAVLDLSKPGAIERAGKGARFDLVFVPDAADDLANAIALRLVQDGAVAAGIFGLAPKDVPPDAFVCPLEAGPISFVSRRYWYLGGELTEYTLCLVRPPRLLFVGKDRVAKICRDDSQLNQRATSEQHNEIAFLQDPPLGAFAPRLLMSGVDHGVIWLVRDKVEGRDLSDLMANGDGYDHDRVIADVLDELVALERHGLFHDDVQDHNIVIDDDGRARLIDFGSISRQRSHRKYPDDLFVAFLALVRQVTGRISTSGMPGFDTRRAALLDIAALPDRYRDAFEQFFALPPERWSFAAMQSLLSGNGATEMPRLPHGANLLNATLHRAVSAQHDALGVQEQALRDQAEQLADVRARLNWALAELKVKSSDLAVARRDLAYAASIASVIKRLRAKATIRTVLGLPRVVLAWCLGRSSRGSESAPS
jgi:tRNA A-37 threonylcarbamoyl transferase component Bud32